MMVSQVIQVMIVDDHTLVRKGLKIVLEEFEGISVVGEASNGLKAIEIVERLRPDVILMDLAMPFMDGIETTKRIIAIRPDQHILILTAFLDEEKTIQAIQAGAQGCVGKDIASEELAKSIRDVCSGKPTLDSTIAWKLFRGMTNVEKTRQSPRALTNREVIVLRLLTQGKLDYEIAQELFLAEVTIRTHISRILTKLALENRVQAALYGLRSGLVTISETSELLATR